MDPVGEEQLDYEDDEYGGGQRLQFQGSGAISALAEEELIGEDEEYDDLYNDLNVGDGFIQSMNRTELPVSLGNLNGNPPEQKIDSPGLKVLEPISSQEVSIPGVGVEGNDSNIRGTGFSDLEPRRSGYLSGKGLEEGTGNYPDVDPQKGGVETQVGSLGFRGLAPVAPKIAVDPSQVPGKFVGGPSLVLDSSSVVIRPGPNMSNNRMGTVVNHPTGNENSNKPILGSVENGITMLFVGELHWWTTDAELESVLSQYGRVKEIKFFDERASGKSRGFCQVEFYDPGVASACKEGMNGYVFNGRACVVTFANSQNMRQGGGFPNRNQGQVQSQSQGRRVMNDGVGRGGGMNYQSGDGGRNYGRGGWGRGQGLQNRGPGGGGPMRGRGSIGGRGMVGGTGGVGSGATGGHYGQGLTVPGMGGPLGGMMHPQSMMSTGFDHIYMGRGGGYGGFSGPAFPGMMPSFPAVNTVALPGVAPHVNPAFFGRGMSGNGIGIMGSTGMEGHQMWTDTNMAGWVGDEHGRTTESSYGGDDVASDYGYAEVKHESGGRSNASREKDRGSERDCPGNSERRQWDERESDWDRSDRDRYREERDGYRDRQRERDWDDKDDWDRGQSSSRSRSKSHIIQEEDHQSRSRDPDYGKRRRLPSE